MPDQPNPKAVDVWFVQEHGWITTVITPLNDRPACGLDALDCCTLKQNRGHWIINSCVTSAADSRFVPEMPIGHGVLSTALDEPVDLRE